MSTRLTVCVGGGGVGKTTTSSALALSLARRKRKTLVITVDPARRLADALGAEVGRLSQPVLFEDDSRTYLYARMPDSQMSLDDFAAWLFEDPVQRERVKKNQTYLELGDSMAGVHELVTIGLLQTEIDSGQWDEVVLDTAPSRHALAFLTYPSRLLRLLEARALAWLATLAQRAETQWDEYRPDHGLFAWGRSKAESVVGKLVGLEGLRSLSSLFADLVSVRDRWASLARRTDDLLRADSTRYFIVTAPTGGAMADAEFMVTNLSRHELRPAKIVLNRAESAAPAFETRIEDALIGGAAQLPVDQHRALLSTLALMRSEHTSRSSAATKAIAELQRLAPPGTGVVRLPFVHRSDPQAIVLSLADAWAEDDDDL